MQMSERQRRVLSLLERLGRGRDLPARRGGSGSWQRGRSPKHRTSQEVREQVVMLRRGKYEGFNDQHFTEKLVEVEGLELARETVRRIPRRRRERSALVGRAFIRRRAEG